MDDGYTASWHVCSSRYTAQIPSEGSPALPYGWQVQELRLGQGYCHFLGDRTHGNKMGNPLQIGVSGHLVNGRHGIITLAVQGASER